MMAFAAAEPGKPHPGPWAPVRGGFSFKSRVELSIDKSGVPEHLSASLVAWLVAALCRLKFQAPVRLAVLGNMPFNQMGQRWQTCEAVAFEASPHHFGWFRSNCAISTEVDLAWLRRTLPVIVKLYRDDRFKRSFGVYDEACWSTTIEQSSVLIWTAIETLFDLSAEQSKTKAIARSLSEWVAVDAPDQDRAYGVIRDLHEKRGRVVHVARSMAPQDYLQSISLARAAFITVLELDALPPGRAHDLIH